jgi:large subunit ribosomal protein L37Ae
MAKKETFGSVRRFGSRYGRTIRYKIGKIEESRRQSTSCPFCKYKKVERMSAGIWLCTKCKAKFTGRAYDFSQKPRPLQVVQEAEEAPEETEEVKA